MKCRNVQFTYTFPFPSPPINQQNLFGGGYQFDEFACLKLKKLIVWAVELVTVKSPFQDQDTGSQYFLGSGVSAAELGPGPGPGTPTDGHGRSSQQRGTANTRIVRLSLCIKIFQNQSKSLKVIDRTKPVTQSLFLLIKTLNIVKNS